jgi:death-on-curing protein
MMRWVKIDRVLAIHSRQILEHGGVDGVRDMGLLESAIARPQNLVAYQPDSDIAAIATAYGAGIIRNHPFLDGNKRTGYVVLEVFLVLNSYKLTATQQEKYRVVLGLADGSLDDEDLAIWLRERISSA